jgi:hypothetical protein
VGGISKGFDCWVLLMAATVHVLLLFPFLPSLFGDLFLHHVISMDTSGRSGETDCEAQAGIWGLCMIMAELCEYDTREGRWMGNALQTK